jgi:hypothetical protein
MLRPSVGREQIAFPPLRLLTVTATAPKDLGERVAQKLSMQRVDERPRPRRGWKSVEMAFRPRRADRERSEVRRRFTNSRPR